MREKNPCLGCDCYDPDMGCSMPSIDLWYACSIYDNSRDIAERLYEMCNDMDCHDYDETREENIKALELDIQKAKENELGTLLQALEIICFYK